MYALGFLLSLEPKLSLNRLIHRAMLFKQLYLLFLKYQVFIPCLFQLSRSPDFRSHPSLITTIPILVEKSILRTCIFIDVLKDFYVEWQALDKMSEQDTTKLPTLSKTNTPRNLIEALKRFYVLNQHANMTNQQCLEKFKNSLDVIEHCGGQVGAHPGLMSEKND